MNDNRKKLLIILIIAAFIFSLFTLYISSEELFKISARAAAVYEPETERFIYMKNPDERLGMASTTKIMTALIALETLDEDEMITANADCCGIDGSSLYLRPGETMNVIDLIYALLLQSANDAACVLAHRIAGGIEEFANLMNRKAEELGLKNTHFKNPHGLDDKDHYTTARDLSLLTAEAMKNERFLDITSTKRQEIRVSDETKIIVNHNKMLNRRKGCVGVKTGYTKKCGRCLVSSANDCDIQVIAVTLDAPDDWRDHEKLYELAYSMIERRTLCERGDFEYDIMILGGRSDTVKISAKEKVSVIVDKDTDEITPHIKLSQYYSAPIAKNEIMGTVIFTVDEKEIGRAYLVAENNVDKIDKYKFFKLKGP